MRHLYLRIYLAFVGVLVIFMLLMSLAWWTLRDDDERRSLDTIALLVSGALPPSSAPRDELQSAINQLAQQTTTQITLRAADGTLLVHAGDALPAPPAGLQQSGFRHLQGVGHVALLHLPDGRWIVAKRLHDNRKGYGLLAALVILASALAIGAYPVVRSITGKLERLRARVEALGAGDLSVRVDVEGRDEVAALAHSFNHTAQRLEKLVRAQRNMLASASHELRSPLARMRIALELLRTDNKPELRDRLASDIAELDELIGDILLASRLDTSEQVERHVQVDLLALLAEEAARTDASTSGTPETVNGDPRLLRHLLRNLLENARRYSSGNEVQASISRVENNKVLITVEDHGPGVPENERERIFEPFYRAQGTRETGEGVGLGLALVRQIAEHHNGSVRCVARAGGGSRFEVVLPA